MKVLVTGANGFVGRNLVCALESIRDGKDRTRPCLSIDEIFKFDIDTDTSLLETYCKDCDFVFNLAGVNRPQNTSEFMEGNFGFASLLLDTLKECNSTSPVMISSSTQAALDNDYGKSKKAGEDLLFEYGRETGSKVYVYRFPNLFGKWCRPNYNSAVATFCDNIANDLPIQVNNRDTELTLVYIDDLVQEMLNALEGRPNVTESRLCAVPVEHKVTLGTIVDLLYKFNDQPKTLLIPDIPNNSFEKKLYSTFLSYLPKEKIKFEVRMNEDDRGSFTELIKTSTNGQFSVNVSRPGITKGQHWHNSKWEFFIVVSGQALIQERKIGTEEVINLEVSGKKIELVHMLPGYTHNIINLSKTENLVTLMWANESFNINSPDTFYETV